MNNHYQPIVVKKSTKMMELLDELDFFKENEISDRQFVFEYFCDVFTKKFINGELSDDDVTFHENEIEKYLIDIIIKNTIQSLINDGIVSSIEDENNEELFFLTNLGKNILKKIK